MKSVVCSGVDSRKLGATAAAMVSVVGHVMAMPTKRTSCRPSSLTAYATSD